MTTIDLNCDMGESFGPWKMGDDAALMESISSASIACGAHAGDPDVMLATVRLAKRHGVAVGAHPGYFDLRSFGRRFIRLDGDEVMAMVLYQVGALSAIARAAGVELSHVKAHGALYNEACRSVDLAAAFTGAVELFSRELPVFGLPGSELEKACAEAGLPFVREGFADRAYEPNGSLVDRKQPYSLLIDPQSAAQNALDLARGHVRAHDGTDLSMQVDTLCVHGDTPGAAEIAREVRRTLMNAGFTIGHDW